MARNEEKQVQMPWANLRLPPFPQVAVRVLQLASEDSVPMLKLCDLISSDPAFASEVLTIANSALYAPVTPCSSILHAITMLGATTLQGMCVTVGVRAYLGKAMSHPAIRNLWRHNLACALLAQRLADAGYIDKDMAYTAGILHDVGRIALAIIQPKGYAELLEQHKGTPESMLEAERSAFGWNHCETGLKLISGWKLSDELVAVVTDHHQQRRGDGTWDLTELVKVSCAMSSAAGFSAFAGYQAKNYEQLLDELPARERRLFPPDIASLTHEVGEAIHAIESV
jgi:putative nucleotidyltransferase with HDIG domain